jgi:alpha-galactosidase/6-phospho-beta-glucosidase family protein
MEYVSPFDDQARVVQPFASRTRELSGSRVALLDINKARGAEFLDEVERQLQERGAKTFRIAKERFSRPASTEILERLTVEADLVVEALAD